jgi:ADP-L-glycero-D-manno-heptose 6-epimerase
MKILVTGHKGFIGSNLASYLKYKGHEVEGWDWQENKYPDASKYDRVIHLGALTSTTETDVEKVMKQNYEFTMKLIEICDMMGTSLQFASSASVYGPGLDGYREDSKCLPQSPYAWSKYLIDRWIAEYENEFKINIQGFRYFNVYGNGEEHKGDQASPVTKFTKQAKETGEILLFENSENYLRDFISVQDVCLVHEKMLEKDVNGVFNLGTGVPRSFKSIAEVIAKKYNAKIVEIPMPEAVRNQYQTYTCADMTKTLSHIDHTFIRPEEWIHESK